MTVVVAAEVERFNTNMVRMEVVLECENELVAIIENARLVDWVNQLAKQTGEKYDTTRIEGEGDAQYGTIE